MVFLCAKIEIVKFKMNKFGYVHIWYICPPPPKNLFLFLHLIFKLFFVLLFLDFGDFLLKDALAGMRETIAYRLLKNEEPSDSIGITIAVIIDVNY